MRSILEKWFHLYYQQWYLCLDHLKEPFVIFGNLFCSFGVINMWHIQDLFFDVLVGNLLGDGPPSWHPLSQKFWCTFPPLFIVTRFQQQPFEKFEPTLLDMNVFTIDWDFLQGHFCIYINFHYKVYEWPIAL
jgi:hypothetical protein